MNDSHIWGKVWILLLGISNNTLSVVKLIQYTVWPEILAGIYFGRLMKLLHMAKFTLAVGWALCHNDIHSKMANPEQARARLQWWWTVAVEYTHCWMTISGLFSFQSSVLSTSSSTYKGEPKPPFGRSTDACACLWLFTQSYRSNAETENRPLKSSTVSYRQWYQHQSSQRCRSDSHWVPRADKSRPLFFYHWCPKPFGNVVCLYTAVGYELHTNN